MRYKIGIDIGGTFTDLVMVDLKTGNLVIDKLLTTPDDPSRAVLEGLDRVLTKTEVPASEVGARIAHGTTIVGNAIITRIGHPTALITTEGFKDLVEMGREGRFTVYDIGLETPKPIVPRQLRFGVPERMNYDGTVIKPLDEARIEELALALANQGVEAVAVSFLHAYRNASHERKVREIFTRVTPQIYVSLSSDVVAEIREYERTSTTICNAYVQPVVDSYVTNLERELERRGLPGSLFVMMSNGGLGTSETARRFPIRLLESGPAGAALAAAHFGGNAGQKKILAFDMGGTTAKTCLINDGTPRITTESETARAYRFAKGSGLPVKVPGIDMIEIGAGGGSIAAIDSLGLLKVGPRSASSVPGPASYGRGGAEPTVTDADLVLGYLNPDYFLGGEMKLEVELARKAMQRVAGPLGIDAVEAAWRIQELVNEEMASSSRIHCVEQGEVPENYTLVAFGGAGPVHAYRLAEKLGCRTLIFPFGAGVSSSFGFLVAPIAFDFVRSRLEPLSETAAWGAIAALYDEMERDGVEMLQEAGVALEDIILTRIADTRYQGQGYEIRTVLPNGPINEQSAVAFRTAFENEYHKLYGRKMDRLKPEVVNWRLIASTARPQLGVQVGGQAGSNLAVASKGSRPVYLPGVGFTSCPVWDRYRLFPGAVLTGPAIIEERESTAVVGVGAQVTVDTGLNLVVTLPQA